MINSSDRGPHHAEDTGGDKVILVEFVAEMVPHDSPEFQERARQATLRPVPDYLKTKPETDRNPPAPT